MSAIFTTQEMQVSADLRSADLRSADLKSADLRAALKAASLKARMVGIFYLLTFLAGGLFLFAGDRLGFLIDLTAGVSYIAVAVLFYTITKGA